MDLRRFVPGRAREDDRPRWRNWAGNQVCAPLRIHRPLTEAELVLIVRTARAEQERVRVAGGGRSYSGVALSDGHLVEIEGYNALLDLNVTRGLVTVQAGVTLRRLEEELWSRGFVLPAWGDAGESTLGGAISTGTHGSGLHVTSLAAQVTALRIVTGTGDVLDCSLEREREVFEAAVTGLGAAGILSTVTLKVQPAAHVLQQEETSTVEAVLERQSALLHAGEQLEAEVDLASGEALIRKARRTDRTPDLGWRERLNDEVATRVGQPSVKRAEQIAPPLAERLGRVLPHEPLEERIDRAHRLAARRAGPRRIEMEYVIPRQHAREAIERIRTLVQRSGWRPALPAVLRWAAPDTVPLSMCYRREAAALTIRARRSEAYQPLFEAVETVMRDYEGRPHWGKVHFQTHETLRPLYPRWDEFQTTRRRLDPSGVFGNTYTDRVLGAVR